MTPDSVQRIPLTISIMLAASMFTIDSTIANVALPHMQGGLSAGLDQITWVLTSFIVAQALMTPLVGWLAVRLGRRRLMLVSIVVFVGASIACGLAQGIALAVQGALLVRFAPDFVADAFCASRLADSAFGGGAFGNLSARTDFASLLARAWPEH